VERYTGRIIILSGGEPLETIDTIAIPEHDLVIAADSGLHHASVLGLDVDLVIGDMDSVDADALDAAVKSGSVADRYPVDKDSTDLELAVRSALAREARHIAIIGSHTGRLDHLLGAIGLFIATVPLVDDLVWLDGTTTITGCAPGTSVRVNDAVGDRLSLIPTGTDAVDITTSGLRWNLAAETLPAGSTRGISNIVMADPATITVGGGVLLVVHERTTP